MLDWRETIIVLFPPYFKKIFLMFILRERASMSRAGAERERVGSRL